MELPRARNADGRIALQSRAQPPLRSLSLFSLLNLNLDLVLDLLVCLKPKTHH